MKLLLPILVCSILLPAWAEGSGAPQQDAPTPTEEKKDSIPIAKLPDTIPPTLEALDESLSRGVRFLLDHQNKDGSWGDHTGTKGVNIFCPYPSGPLAFRSGTTGLCILGLNASPERDTPAVREALEKATRFMFDKLPKLKRGDTRSVYDVWGHAYTLEAACSLASRLPKDSKRFLELRNFAAERIRSLDELADVNGGWGYLTFKVFTKRPAGSPTSFLTATVFIAYKDAEDLFGLKSDPKVFHRCFNLLKSMRTPNGAYVYAREHIKYSTTPINRHTGSLARTPAGDLALLRYDPALISERQLEDGLDRLWSRSGWLSMALKKPLPHESFAQNSGYFYFYGYYYAAKCLDYIPDEKLVRHAAYVSKGVLPLQEKDGSWWDYPLYNYHKFYGTGYALYALSRVRETLADTHRQPASVSDSPAITQPTSS